jgi:hypothetical protein
LSSLERKEKKNRSSVYGLIVENLIGNKGYVENYRKDLEIGDEIRFGNV